MIVLCLLRRRTDISKYSLLPYPRPDVPDHMNLRVSNSLSNDFREAAAYTHIRAIHQYAIRLHCCELLTYAYGVYTVIRLSSPISLGCT